jgi:hypothetical protein
VKQDRSGACHGGAGQQSYVMVGQESRVYVMAGKTLTVELNIQKMKFKKEFFEPLFI